MNTPVTQSINATPRFRGQVLRQIYRVWLFRTFLPVLIIEIAVCSVILYELANVIFFQRIFENALNVLFSNPSGIVSFFLSAFSHAPIMTKALIVAILLALAFFIRHVTQGILRFILVRQNYFSKIKKDGERG